MLNGMYENVIVAGNRMLCSFSGKSVYECIWMYGINGYVAAVYLKCAARAVCSINMSVNNGQYIRESMRLMSTVYEDRYE